MISVSLASCAPFQVRVPSSLQQPDAQIAVEVLQKPVVDENERGALTMRVGGIVTSLMQTSDEKQSKTARAKGPFPFLIDRVTHTYRYAFTVEPTRHTARLLVACNLIYTYDSEVEDEGENIVSTTRTNQKVLRTCEVTDEQNMVATISFTDAPATQGSVGAMRFGTTVYSLEPIRKAHSRFHELSPGMAGSGVYGYRLVQGNRVVAATQTMLPVRLYSSVDEGTADFTAIAVFFGVTNYPGYLFPNAF